MTILLGKEIKLALHHTQQTEMPYKKLKK